MNDENETKCCSFFKRIKNIFYNSTANRLLEPSLPKWIYCFLLIIENIQIVNYSFIFTSSASTNNHFSQYIVKVSQYFDFSGWQNTILGNLQYWYEVVVILTIITMMVGTMALVVQLVMEINKKTNNCMYKYLCRFINIFGILFTTIFMTSIEYVLLTSITKHFHSDALFQYVTFIISIFLIINYVIFFWLFVYLLDVVSPFSHHPWASLSSNSHYYKIILKLILPFLLVFDITSYTKLVLGFLLLICTGWLIVQYYDFDMYSFPQNKIKRNLPIVCFWVNLCCFYQSFWNFQNNSIGYLVIGTILILLAWEYLLQFRTKRHLLIKDSLETVSSKSNLLLVNQNFSQLIKVLSFIQNQNSEFLLLYLNSHYKKCNNISCYCRIIVNNILQKIPLNNIDWYSLVSCLIQLALQIAQNKQKFYLNIFASYITLYKFNKLPRSIYYLHHSQQSLTSYTMSSFTLFQLHSQVQRAMINNYLEIHQDPFILQQFFKITHNLTKWRKRICNLSNELLVFWKFVYTDRPSGQKLSKMAISISKNLNTINEQFQQLLQCNQNDMLMLRQYEAFLFSVLLQQNNKLKKHINQVKILFQKKQNNKNKLKARAVSEAGFIIISIEQKIFGNIIFANSTALKQLDCRQSDIVEQNLNKLIPVFMRDTHQQTMINYLKRQTQDKIHLNRNTTVITPEGHVVYCEVDPHFLPDISEGIRISAIFSSINKQYKHIGCLSDGTIFGISKTLQQQYPWMFKYVNENTPNIMKLFPELDFLKLKQIKSLSSQIYISKPKHYSQSETHNSLDERWFYKSITIVDTKIYENYEINILQLKQIPTQISVLSSQFQIAVKQQESLCETPKLHLNQEIDIDSKQRQIIKGQQLIQSKKQPLKIKWLKIITSVCLLLLLLSFIFSFGYYHTQTDSIISSSKIFKTIYNFKAVSVQINGILRNLQFISRKNSVQPESKYFQSLQFNKTLELFNIKFIQMTQQYTIFSRTPKINSLTSSITSIRQQNKITYKYQQQQITVSNLLIRYMTWITSLLNMNISSLSNYTYFLKQQIHLEQGQNKFSVYMIINLYKSIIPAFDDIIKQIQQHHLYELSNFKYWYLYNLIVGVVLLLIIILIDSICHKYYQTKYSQILGLYGGLTKSEIKLRFDSVVLLLDKHFDSFAEVDIRRISENQQVTSYRLMADQRQQNFKGLNSLSCFDNSRRGSQQSHGRTYTQQSFVIRQTPRYPTKKIIALQDKIQKQKSDYIIATKIKNWNKSIIRTIIKSLVLIVFILGDYMNISIAVKNIFDLNQKRQSFYNKLIQIQQIPVFLTQSLLQTENWPLGSAFSQVIRKSISIIYQSQIIIQSITNNKIYHDISDMNIENICDQNKIFMLMTEHGKSQQCKIISEGVLEDGLKTAIVKYINFVQSYYSLSSPNMTQQHFMNITSSKQYIQNTRLNEYISATILQKILILHTIPQNTFKRAKRVLSIKLIVFVTVALPLLLIIIFLTIRQLNKTIQNSKTMLLLLSFTQIRKQNQLFKKIKDNNILQAFTTSFCV